MTWSCATQIIIHIPISIERKIACLLAAAAAETCGSRLGSPRKAKPASPRCWAGFNGFDGNLVLHSRAGLPARGRPAPNKTVDSD